MKVSSSGLKSELSIHSDVILFIMRSTCYIILVLRSTKWENKVKYFVFEQIFNTEIWWSWHVACNWYATKLITKCFQSWRPLVMSCRQEGFHLRNRFQSFILTTSTTPWRHRIDPRSVWKKVRDVHICLRHPANHPVLPQRHHDQVARLAWCRILHAVHK